MRKSIRIVILIIAAAMLFGCPVSAEEYDYTINGEETVAIPKSYIYLYSINRLNTNVDSNAYLNQPSAMVFGKDGYLYIAEPDCKAFARRHGGDNKIRRRQTA